MLFSQPEIPYSHNAGHPPVRTVLARRLSRLRVTWFLLGSIAGAGLGYFIVSLMHHDSEYSRRMNFSHAVAMLDAKLSPLPAPPVALVGGAAVSIDRNANPAPPPLAAAFNASEKLSLPASYTIHIRRGDTLESLLMNKGVSNSETHEILQSMKHFYNPRDLAAGRSLELHVDKNPDDPLKPSVTSLSLTVSPLKTLTVTRADDNSFHAREMTSPVFKGLARAGGEIHSSLYQTASDAGIPAPMLSEIIEAFSYDVDFQRDLREGDAIDVVFERMHTDKNVTTGYGKILYASLTLGDETFTVYRHASSDGFSGYYNVKGDSVKKALLKTPINGARITSGFGMRVHPLLGYSKMHKGIDFGAAVGTPIYAAGDGIIEEAGRKGGYGNYVRVKHSDHYATAYGHASRIARGIRAGAHVKQGQVIAYVGSTGFSTGPHLHYEILVNGAQVNPSGVKFRTGQTLAGHELAEFKKQVKDVQVALNTLPRNRQVASLER